MSKIKVKSHLTPQPNKTVEELRELANKIQVLRNRGLTEEEIQRELGKEGE